MCNSWDDVAEVSAVLRSWEDRFGAVLVRMHLSVLELAVAAPPWTVDDCVRVAAEHFAFTCDDDSPTPKTLRQYAQGLRGVAAVVVLVGLTRRGRSGKIFEPTGTGGTRDPSSAP